MKKQIVSIVYSLSVFIMSIYTSYLHRLHDFQKNFTEIKDLFFKRKIFLTAGASVVFFFTAANCKQDYLRGKSPGRDYFSRDFHCKKTLIPAEQKEKYLIYYDEFRKKIFVKTEKKSVFAVITGDSTSALFFPERLTKYVPGFEIINRGIGGDTTYMLLRRLDEDIVSLNPKTIIIEIGGNDILGGRCISAALQNTDLILNHLLSRLPTAQIILVSIPPVSAWKANSITPFYNRKLEYLADRYSRVQFMDLWVHLSEEDKPMLKKKYRFFFPDGKLDYVHLNEEGYRKWGEMLIPILKKIR
ncbi:MAG: GDSL-type esterase/lipase family protein [Spirochaetia bacterium]|nr:GDSL-type esterase/lipase family protein [Spirochaetia bacterium]